MRDRSSSITMSAIVVGTYICAMYGAFGTPVRARSIPADRPVPRLVITKTPATAPANTVQLADVR